MTDSIKPWQPEDALAQVLKEKAPEILAATFGQMLQDVLMAMRR